MSNRYSKDRQILKRPKVCKSKAPIPGVPATTNCSTDPKTGTVMLSEPFHFSYTFFDALRPVGETIVIEPTFPFGDLFVDPITENGIPIAMQYSSEMETGVADVKVKGISDSGANCTATTTITVTL